MRRALLIVQLQTLETRVARDSNRNIVKVLRLSRDMMLLADMGDENRHDTGCGVLYGTLRDTAYKLRQLAEQEIQAHKSAGIWDNKEQNVD
jgi:hypothetical protein